MPGRTGVSDPTRRAILKSACVGAGVAAAALPSLRIAVAADDEMALVQRLTGRTPTESDRIRLEMPPVFANGYTVPLALEVDCPMTDADHVRSMRIFAPRNPLVEVAGFHFTPQSGRARISTRIRLAQPQDVVAVAEMSDGTFLMTKRWVEVATNGCA
jgi:sulfur-oxidizing protein SoxY